MNINLGPQWEGFIAQSIESGRYVSASEVVREALRLLQNQEEMRQAQLEELRREIRKGIDQLDRGDAVELDDAGLDAEMARIKREGRRRRTKKAATAA
jgi:antitoxin ParD1/3/4